MSAPGLHRLLEVCQEALARPAGERPAYPDGACAGDSALRRAVEALLAEQSSAPGVLDRPAWNRDRAPLAAGSRLGPYEVGRLIGAGGMGEVYEGRDTRLGRTVAIKALPPELAADPGRRLRFEQEARAVSALNHPHMCTLHDVGHHDPSAGSGQAALYLVMEYLAGQTLAERLRKGALPVEQALTVVTEIADALAAAHRQGIIHRDLKPANVMLTKTGAQLLDFGLAKLKAHGEQPAAQVASMPTQSQPLTAEGVIVGTLPYMAPEQVEGKPADACTDLWALGAILYEMLAGKPAFHGESAATLIGNIMHAEPAPLASRQPLTPPALDRLVQRCLAKSPDDRWQSASDLADEFRWLRESSAFGPQPGLTVQHPSRRKLVVAVGLPGLACALVGAGVTWLVWPATRASGVTHLSLEVHPAETLFTGWGRTSLCWAPDGKTLVFVGRRGSAPPQLCTRRLDSPETSALADTERAQTAAVSPDGQWVAFWANADPATGRKAAIRRVALAGGPAADLLPGIHYAPRGLVYDDHGNLFFGNDADGRIWEIPAAGEPKAVTTLGEAEYDHVLPWPLAGGSALLYTIWKRPGTWGLEDVVAETLATHVRTPLLKNAIDARYLPTGHLVFMRQCRLFVVPFEATRLEVLGKEVAVLDGVAQALYGRYPFVSGAGQFAVSRTGLLAWVQGSLPTFEDTTLVRVTRAGDVRPIPAQQPRQPDRELVRGAEDKGAGGRTIAPLDGWPTRSLSLAARGAP
jgi:serine/threonine protein kinase